MCKRCQYQDLIEAILKCIRGIKDQNLPLLESMVFEKAVECSSCLEYSDFPVSIVWLEKFKRHRVF